VDGNASELCPVMGFGFSSVDSLGSATRVVDVINNIIKIIIIISYHKLV
jgi:hypothetical protein